MYKVQYSAFTYYPSFLLTDNTTIGVLFHNLTTNERRFEMTSNITKVTTTYDELEPELLQLILMSIRDTACNDSSTSFDSTPPKFNLLEFTKFYVNEFKFTPITDVEVEDFEEFINEAKKIYLRYDYEKSLRPTVSDELKFLKRIIPTRDKCCSTKPVVGQYNDDIKFDYILNKEYAIKLFDFNSPNQKKSISTARNWAMAGQEVSNKYKIVFICSYDKDLLDLEARKKLDSAIAILKNNSYKTLGLEEGTSFISSLKLSLQNQLSI